MKAYISPHWFRFTVPIELTDTGLDGICVKLFGHSFGQFEKSYKGRDGYRDHYSLAGLVSVCRNGYMANRGTTLFDVTGTGLDTLGLDILDLGRFALDQGGNICRIDLACLDTGNHLPYDDMVDCCTGDNFKSRVRTRFNRGKGNLPEIRIQPVRRILFGSERSDNYAVIYDRQKVEGLDFHCINIEQRITNRADCAAIIKELIAGADAGEYYAGLLRGKLEFLEAGTGRKDTRKVASWWSDFLGDVATRKLKRCKPDRPWKHQPSELQKVMKHISRLHDRGDYDSIQAIQTKIDDMQLYTGDY